MEPYKTFIVQFDSTKLNRFICNDPVKNGEKYIMSDDEEAPKNPESSSDKKRKQRESCSTNFWKNNIT